MQELLYDFDVINSASRLHGDKLIIYAADKQKLAAETNHNEFWGRRNYHYCGFHWCKLWLKQFDGQNGTLLLCVPRKVYDGTDSAFWQGGASSRERPFLAL